MKALKEKGEGIVLWRVVAVSLIAEAVVDIIAKVQSKKESYL